MSYGSNWVLFSSFLNYMHYNDDNERYVELIDLKFQRINKGHIHVFLVNYREKMMMEKLHIIRCTVLNIYGLVISESPRK